MIKVQSGPSTMELDLVGLQQRLAGFKLIINPPQTSGPQISLQSLFQHRLEGCTLRQIFMGFRRF